ncbi:hypothetical protein C0J52_17550 [Blattella germanica]|nr:hypothetical protein C0J52_17550 [Blattella germanica]
MHCCNSVLSLVEFHSNLHVHKISVVLVHNDMPHHKRTLLDQSKQHAQPIDKVEYLHFLLLMEKNAAKICDVTGIKPNIISHFGHYQYFCFEIFIYYFTILEDAELAKCYVICNMTSLHVLKWPWQLNIIKRSQKGSFSLKHFWVHEHCLGQRETTTIFYIVIILCNCLLPMNIDISYLLVKQLRQKLSPFSYFGLILKCEHLIVFLLP